jgi:hypothetical protein
VYGKNKFSADTTKYQLFIDTGVYTRNRAFRLLGSSKFGRNTTRLKLIKPFVDPLACISFMPLESVTPLPIGEGLLRSEKDKNLFFNSLICPFWSLDEAKEKMKTKGKKLVLLEAEEFPHLSFLTSISAARIGKSRLKNEKHQSEEGYGNTSPFSFLDAFILTQANKGGIQGEIRSWNLLYTTTTTTEQTSPTSQSFNKRPWLLTYQMCHNRYCENIQRAHKSNNIMFIVDFIGYVFYQKCHDQECQAQQYR